MRPQGIVRFAILYPIALAIDQVGSLLYMTQSGIWSRAGAAAPVSLLLVILLGLALWFLVVWRHSTIAKWVILALFAINVASLGISLLNLRFTLQLSQIMGILALSIRAIAVRNLFFGDTKIWFQGQSSASLQADDDTTEPLSAR